MEFFKLFLKIFFDYFIPLTGLITIFIGVHSFVKANRLYIVRYVNCRTSFDIWKGYSLSIRIENCTQQVIEISKLDLVVEEKYIINICDNEKPLLIEPYRTKEIKSGWMSAVPETIDNSLSNKTNKSKIYITLANGKHIYATWFNKSHKCRKKGLLNKYNYETIPVERYYYNDKIVAENVHYVVFVIKRGRKVYESFIHDAGHLEVELKGYTAIPKGCMQNSKTIKDIVEDILCDDELKVIVKRIR